MPAAGAMPTSPPSARARPAISDATAVPCGSTISPPRLTTVPTDDVDPVALTGDPGVEDGHVDARTRACGPTHQLLRLGDPQPVERGTRVGGGDDLVAHVVAPHAVERAHRDGVRRHGREGGHRHRRQHGDGREPAGYSHGFPLARTGGHRASDTDRFTPRSKSSTHGSGTTGGSTSANPRLAATSGPTSG